MKVAYLIALGLTLWVGGAHPALAQNMGTTSSETVTEHRWVGFTTTTTDGSIQAEGGALQGHPAMHRLCAIEVAPNARACVTSEIVRSVVEGRRDSRGWVVPTGHVLRHSPGESNGGAWFTQDPATGLTGEAVTAASSAYRFLGCDGYLSNEVSGIVANASGLDTASCGTRHAIACCAPVAIPVTPAR